MCPLVQELRTRKNIKTLCCVTGQHRQMLDQVLDAFYIAPDYDLAIMKDGQTLFDITIRVMEQLKAVLEEAQPDLVLVHGDTTTTFVVSAMPFRASATRMSPRRASCDVSARRSIGEPGPTRARGCPACGTRSATGPASSSAARSR